MRYLQALLLTLPLALACPGEPDSDQSTIHIDESEDPNESGGGDNLVIGDDSCETDDDCVPAECCHAAACVGVNNRPECADVMCTQDCQYGTLDCGGRCLCHEGRCAAQLSETPEFAGPGIDDDVE